MAIPSTGPINFSDLQTEFGGINPISLSEYYRGEGYVPSTGFIGLNNAIPSSGMIRSSNFIGTSKTTTVSYDILGGGGGGGYGLEAGFSNDRAGDGQASSLVFGVNTFIAAGGLGGLNAQPTSGDAGTPGESSAYGAGGAGGAEQRNGSPATGFGAGGGAAGGDFGNNAYDAPGGAGRGGAAGARTYGELLVTFGSTFIITIGGGGAGGDGTWDGGAGSQGICRLIYNGVIRDITSTSVITIN